MSFADPQTVTVNTVAKTLPRVSSPNPSLPVGTYRTADGEFTLEVRQNQTANRFRREIRLTQTKIALDPISAVNKQVSASFIIAFDTPKVGFSALELGYMSSALISAFTASQRDKLLGGEI